MGETNETPDTDFDPGEYTIQELGPAIKEIDDLDELETILEKEQAGNDRVGATKLIESRIEKFAEEDEMDDDEIDPTGMSPAEMGNVLRDIDDVELLEELVQKEEAGEDRGSVKRLIQNRIESVGGSEEGEAEAELPPEEKYPDLDHPTEDKQYVESIADGEYRDMWVYCETQQGELLDVSKEMLGKARELMDGYNADYDEEERVVGILIGDDASEHVEDVIAYGADVVLYQEDEHLSRFLLKPYTEIYAAMARGDDDWRDYDEPRYALFPATNNGRDLSATAMAELDSGLASDCSGLTIEDTVISNPAKTGGSGKKRKFERVLHMKRPDFSGFEYSTILCLDKPNRDFHPQGGSVIPGSFEIPDPIPDREVEVVEWGLDLPDDWFRVEVTDHDVLEGGVDLTGNDVIVALGRGIGDDPTRGIELGMDLVDALDEADLGLSRGVVTASYNFDGHVAQYVSEERQIGESGQEVEPDVYIAAGISGAIQHKVGMDESDTIIAVNTDSGADIRDFSDYFIEGDLFEVLPAMIDAIESGDLDVEAIADGSGGEDA